jgi:NAD(P)H-dependent FMN reductase
MAMTQHSQPSDRPLRLAIIIGSTRTGRFGPVVAKWFLEQTRDRVDLDAELIDLADFALPSVYPGDRDETVRAFTDKLDRADAFVVVTPEYNHGYPASLKQAIDLANREWHAKPVAFVSYGGISGGLRAVEQLRQVFAELHATTIRDTVSFHRAWAAFGDSGLPHDPDSCDAAAKKLLDQLTWWAAALREARATHPYAA